MVWLYLIIATFYTLCLCACLILLWLIWHDSVTKMLKVQQSLIELAMRDADNAQRAIAATESLLASMKTLVDIIGKGDQQKDDSTSHDHL
jgi:hypothetical protein